MHGELGSESTNIVHDTFAHVNQVNIDNNNNAKVDCSTKRAVWDRK